MTSEINLTGIIQNQTTIRPIITSSNGNKINIGQLLNQIGTNSSSQNRKEIISRENYTYKNNVGVLVKYDDGSITFVAKDKSGLTHQINFKNEKALEKKRPHQEIINPGDLQKQTTVNYKYHRNGSISDKDIYNAQGVKIREEDYQKDGKIKNRTVYNKTGEFQSETKWSYDNKNNTSEAKTYGQDHKLVHTTKTQYNSLNQPVSSTITYPNGNLKAEVQYGNGKKVSQKDYYENGQVKAETEFYANGIIKTQNVYNKDGNIIKTITPEIDDHFGPSAQKSEGDCYLMAAINGVRELDNGQEMLNNLVKVSTNSKGEKTYTVSFPGAHLAADGLKNDNRIDPDKMYITGTYTFTESEMQEILQQAGKKYSIGDGNIILLEAAFEQYRTEVEQTMKANGIKRNQFGEAGLQTGLNTDNILAGGNGMDAIFVLTGQTSTVYQNYNVDSGLSYSAALNGTLEVSDIKYKAAVADKAISQIEGGINRSKKDLNNMLDRIMLDEQDGHKDLVATAGFKMVKDNGSSNSGHAFTIKSVDKNTVTLINPWHPDQEVVMSREEFIDTVKNVYVTDCSIQTSNQPNRPNNPDRSNQLLQQFLQQGSSGNTQVPTIQINQIAQQLQQHFQQNPEVTPTPERTQLLQQIKERLQQAQTNGTATTEQTQLLNQIEQIIPSTLTPETDNNQTQNNKPNFKVPEGISYTNMIKQALISQGINPTAENIKIAKTQFEQANPNAVHIYNGKRQDWQGNKYLLANDNVHIPNFKI